MNGAGGHIRPRVATRALTLTSRPQPQAQGGTKGEARRRQAAGFTLIEIMVVVAIISIVVAMSLSSTFFMGHDRRVQQVQAAAYELAATFRKARTRAMETKSPYTVVFNIQNDPASNGRVLNNHTGGHWYRTLGPQASDGLIGFPAYMNNIAPPYSLAEFSTDLDEFWYDDAHVLPAKQVRFIALSDLDWGDYTQTGSGWAGRASSGAVSYPRPWFGWWSQAEKRLYPWGGYDPAITGSGFYFWGNTVNSWAPVDAQPSGCTNPIDRWADRWTPGGVYPSSSWIPQATHCDQIYAAGTPRPLINAYWRDCSLIFLSTGEVRWGNWMPARHCYAYADIGWTGAGKPFHSGVGERCNQLADLSSAQQYSRAEAANFDQDSGGFYITLGPDMPTDNDSYPTAQAALDAMMPLYRVCVTSFGDISVIRVSTIPKYGTLAPFPTSEDWFRTGSNLMTCFGEMRYNTATVKASDNKTGRGVYQGAPITGWVTTDMLTNRSVWMK